MTENEIQELIRSTYDKAPDFETFITMIADMWHESIERVRKETYRGAHTEGYRDGVRDGRNEVQGISDNDDDDKE